MPDPIVSITMYFSFSALVGLKVENSDVLLTIRPCSFMPSLTLRCISIEAMVDFPTPLAPTSSIRFLGTI